MKLPFTFLLCTLPAVIWASPVYTVTDLGSLGGSSAAGHGINGQGQAVGSATDIFGTVQAFVGSTGNVLAGNAQAWEINDENEVAGIQYNNGNSYAMFWSNGSGRMLGGAGSAAMGINEAGQVTGMTAAGHAFVTGNDGQGVRDLGTLRGGNWSVGHAVNESGAVAGYGMVGANFRAFRWVPESGFETLGLLGGNNSYAMAINDSGWVAGHAQVGGGNLHATLWTGSRATDLGTLDHGRNSYAYGVNNGGAVVGSSQTSNGKSHAFLYQDGVMYDLNLLLGGGNGWLLQSAYDINEGGQIVGSGLYNGQEHAFRLDLGSLAAGGQIAFSPYMPTNAGVPGAAAVPEPSTWALALAGLAVCGIRQIRRN